MLTHLSLFSGIGGLDLAAEWAGFQTVGQCEWADYPNKILEKHWPDVPKWRDIHELTATEFYQRTGTAPGQLTCISGGFPCQPHSVAGKRKASADERDMWPEMRRVIGEIRPRWVVGENVRGLLSSEDGRFFRGILGDFAGMGYDVGWCCYRAADVGAIHARKRIAIVAWNVNGRIPAKVRKISCWQMPESNGGNQPFSNAYSDGQHRIVQNAAKKCESGNESCANVYASLLSAFDPKNPPGVFRSNDGAANWMDRVRAIGNAVCPQQFYPIFRAIADIENMNWSDV